MKTPHDVGETNVSKAFRNWRVKYEIRENDTGRHHGFTRLTTKNFDEILSTYYVPFCTNTVAQTDTASLLTSSYACVVVGDWLRLLKLFWDLHIFRHVNKYVNEPEP